MKKKELNTKFVTRKVRMAYVNVFYPKAMGENQDLKYGVCLMIPKDDIESIKGIMVAIDAATENGLKLWNNKVPEDLKMPLRDGDAIADEKPEFTDCYYINATSKIKPGIVDKNLNTIEDSSAVYSGCYGRASIIFYPYSFNSSDGIAVALNNIQKLEDGEYLGNRSSAEEDFAEDSDVDKLFSTNDYEKYIM